MPPNAEPQTPFVRYFSSVEGHLVSRYGTATQTKGPQQIGAKRITPPSDATWRQTDAPVGVVWDLEVIVAITAKEAQAFGREYDRAVNEGALRERTAEEYVAYLKSRKAKSPASEPAPFTQTPEG